MDCRFLTIHLCFLGAQYKKLLFDVIITTYSCEMVLIMRLLMVLMDLLG